MISGGPNNPGVEKYDPDKEYQSNVDPDTGKVFESEIIPGAPGSPDIVIPERCWTPGTSTEENSG